MIQSESVADAIRKQNPHLEVSITKIVTAGDRDHHTSLDRIGVAVFVKELELALISRKVDVAVHSLKDVPTELGKGLTLAAVLAREDVRDVLISKSGKGLAQLPRGARLGTASQRRAVQLKTFRPDLVIRPLRGNIDTRMKKAFSDELDGVVLAGAALARLGWQDRVTEYLSTELCLPMVGQGALSVEVRKDDEEMVTLVSALNHEPTQRSTSAERAFLRALGGGCRAPIAALGSVADGVLRLEGLVASSDGCHMFRPCRQGAPAEAEQVGRLLAEKILHMGAGQFIEEDAR